MLLFLSLYLNPPLVSVSVSILRNICILAHLPSTGLQGKTKIKKGDTLHGKYSFCMSNILKF